MGVAACCSEWRLVRPASRRCAPLWGTPGTAREACGLFKAPFISPAHLLIHVCFLQRRLKYSFGTVPRLPAGCADLQSLDTMQPVERKRQGYIHELIQTEERYVDDLQLVVEVRAVPAGLGGLGL